MTMMKPKHEIPHFILEVIKNALQSNEQILEDTSKEILKLETQLVWLRDKQQQSTYLINTFRRWLKEQRDETGTNRTSEQETTKISE
jgi:phage-related minor tail protein